MARIKIFPKTFLYTLSVLIFIVITAHGIMYVLAPQISLGLVGEKGMELDGFFVSTDVDASQFVTFTIKRALPVSVSCCIVIAIVCAALFSRSITRNICHLSETAQRMTKMDKSAICSVTSGDEIEDLAGNINSLYRSLLKAIHNLELEKKYVQESEKLKIDFLRAASHELKTPVTALNATLENMILGVGKYQDYDVYLPECKEITEQLSEMIHEILETSKMNITNEEKPTEINLPELLTNLCEPYKLIAVANEINFSVCLPQHFTVSIPISLFEKAVSNILANAVAYTESGKLISVSMDGRNLVVENECVPVRQSEIPQLFEPFYRLDYARSREQGGNGLGLYIVDTIFSALSIPYTFQAKDNPQRMCFTIYL